MSQRFWKAVDELRAGVPPIYRTPGQHPTVFYLPELSARPWWEATQFSWAAALEAKTPLIKKELQALTGARPMPSYTSAYAGVLNEGGPWRMAYLDFEGQSYGGFAEACPETMAAMQAIPRRTGKVVFSEIGPKAHILPHHSMTNLHLRFHLGLVVPPACRMRVGEETRPWQEGELTAFDDTFEHEVWNDSDTSRFVLLFEIFHPDLSDREVALAKALAQQEPFRSHFQRWREHVAREQAAQRPTTLG